MFIGIILVILGVLFLIGKFGGHDLGDFISTWWPMVLIIVGIKKITSPGEPHFGSGLIILLIGIILQLISLDWISWHQITYLWPVILILIGLKLILLPKGRPGRSDSSIQTDMIDTVAIFGGTDLTVTSQSFKGGQATALFGAVEIDMRDARLNEGGATIHASAFFGGIDIKVPEGWQVETEGTPIFAALENKCKGTVPEDAPKLLIKASAIFAGIEIKN
jgi:predicted membrane protein